MIHKFPPVFANAITIIDWSIPPLISDTITSMVSMGSCVLVIAVHQPLLKVAAAILTNWLCYSALTAFTTNAAIFGQTLML